MENKEVKLKDRWNNFFNIIGDPWVILLLIVTLILIGISTNSENKDLIGVLNFIISLTSGLLGGVITHRVSQMTEMKVLVARGNSAVRSLKLVLLNIVAVENRIKVNIDNLDKANAEYKLIKSSYEEVIEKCNILEEEIVSSIENWTDIIPEISNFKTQIGVISEMKLKVVELDSEIKKSKEEIENIKELESKKKEELIKELQSKETELTKAKQKLIEKEKELNKSVLGGIIPSASVYNIGTSALGISAIGASAIGLSGFPTGSYVIGHKNKCQSCGKDFTAIDPKQKICPDCKKKGGGFEPVIVPHVD